MKRLMVATIAIFMAVAAQAADTYTTGDLVLTKVAPSSVNWAGKINTNWDIVAARAALKTSSQTFSGQNTYSGQTTFNNKVGFFSSPNTAYGVTLATSALISQPMTFSQSGPLINWANAGSSVSIQGIFTAGGSSGIEILDNAFSWNGRLNLGTLYGPQLYGKGAIGAPRLGLNNAAPAYAFDVTGGGHFTSSMTVDGGMVVTGPSFSVGGSTLVVANGQVTAGNGFSTESGTKYGDPSANIGVSSSGRKLSLYDGAADKASIGFGTSGIWVQNLSASNTNIFQIWGNGADVTTTEAKLTIKQGGNLGLGTTSPLSKLHVVGDGTFSSGVTASSFTATGAMLVGGAVTFSAPTTGGAVCLNASHVLTKCTSAVDASGNCTCP